MMQWMCKIALIVALFAGWLDIHSEPERCSGMVRAQLSEAQSADDPAAEVHRHSPMNLPSSFESLPSSVNVQMRTLTKQHSSRFGSWGTAHMAHPHRSFSKSYGGHQSPQAAAMRMPRVAFSLLCRWII